MEKYSKINWKNQKRLLSFWLSDEIESNVKMKIIYDNKTSINEDIIQLNKSHIHFWRLENDILQVYSVKLLKQNLDRGRNDLEIIIKSEKIVILKKELGYYLLIGIFKKLINFQVVQIAIFSKYFAFDCYSSKFINT